MTYRIETRSAFSPPDEWHPIEGRFDARYDSPEATRAALAGAKREEVALGLEPFGVEYRIAKLEGVADTPLGDPIEIWLPV